MGPHSAGCMSDSQQSVDGATTVPAVSSAGTADNSLREEFSVAGSTVGTGGSPRSVAAVSLWRAKWAILAVIVLAFVASYQYSKDQPATYTAQSRIVLSAAQPFDPLGTYSYNDPTRYVADQVALIRTQAILAPASAQLATQNDPIDPNALSGAVSPEPSATTSVIVVNARASEPDRAVGRANAVALAYEAYLAGQVRGVVDASVAATTDLAVTEDIRAKAAAFGDGVAYVETAAPGEATSSLAPMRTASLVTAVAALVAIGLALLWRTSPPDGSAVINAARTRLLGRVPGRALRRGAAVQPQEHALALVALDYARQGIPGPVLLTGSSARSGAASVAFGLGVSAAAQGRRVLVVDADPERRELARVGSSAPARSLEELGRPGVSRDQVLVPVPTSGGAEVLVAKVGADKSSMVDGVAVGRALAELGQSFDLVLLQSGPVPASPVAFALLEQVAAVVLVARAKDSERSVVELRDRLDAARRPLVGLVLTGRRRGASWVQSQPASAPVQQDPNAPVPAPVQQTPPSSAAQPAEDRDQQLGAPTR